jgi:WXG100 family type VII secretion target
MSDYVRIPYAELFQRASRIRQEAETIRLEIKVMRESIESIEWIGKRADRFFALWHETLPEMESWVLTLDQFADELEDQARRIQAADEAF